MSNREPYTKGELVTLSRKQSGKLRSLDKLIRTVSKYKETLSIDSLHELAAQNHLTDAVAELQFAKAKLRTWYAMERKAMKAERTARRKAEKAKTVRVIKDTVPAPQTFFKGGAL
jgi:hypothetical protein